MMRVPTEDERGAGSEDRAVSDLADDAREGGSERDSTREVTPDLEIDDRDEGSITRAPARDASEPPRLLMDRESRD